MKEIQTLRNAYYDLIIGDEDKKEEVWKKKLRHILMADVHSEPLGCRIPETHIRIGTVHLKSFYEAQLLFSHSHWVQRFAKWLFDQIDTSLSQREKRKRVYIVGYENYIEPVIIGVMKLLKNHGIEAEYGIYEEPKFLGTKDEKTITRIRYEESFGDGHYFYVCGISSTLSTFERMMHQNSDREGVRYFSLIQVFPDKTKNCIEDQRLLDDIVCKETSGSRAVSKKYKITATYLVDVDCEWGLEENCKMCFPDNPIEEIPIIETSETSVVPIQLIEPNEANKTNEKSLYKRINFFEHSKRSKSSPKQVYKNIDFLYYDHIGRMDHHFKYYIRTGDFIRHIADSREFLRICEEIRKGEGLDNEKNNNHIVNVIVFPAHFSNEVFPYLINEYVFSGAAHTISFDTNKEFRTNFITKHSNFAYILEQAKNGQAEIRFYYVDDQLISNESFSRAKSLIESLMQKKDKDTAVRFSVFEAVIVFLSRNSKSTIKSYVEKIEKYYSFVDIEIPSLRSFGDSCPICKMMQRTEEFSRQSTLSVSAYHWTEKLNYYRLKSLEETRVINRGKSIAKKERHFRRFECENSLWKQIKNSDGPHVDYRSIINKEIKMHFRDKKTNEIDAEDLISIAKAISTPFLYYREREKVVALQFIIHVLNGYEYLEPGDIVMRVSPDEYFDYEMTVLFEKGNEDTGKMADVEKKYALLLVLINCLSEMNSTYLLKIERIVCICNVVKRINPNLLSYKKELINDTEYEGFYLFLIYSIKKIICGISGNARVKFFDTGLKEALKVGLGVSKEEIELFRCLYLENTNEERKIDDINDATESGQEQYEQLWQKYELIWEKIEEKIKEKKEEIKEKKEESEESYDITCIKRICFIYSNYDEGLLEPFDNCEIDGIKEYVEETMERPTRLSWNGNYFISEIVADKSGKEKIMLVVEFNDLAETKLVITREILKYRAFLRDVLSEDLRTGSILSSIKARHAKDLLTSEKAIAHGASSDIAELCKISIYAIDKWAEKLDEEAFWHACRTVNQIMSRSIGLYNTAKTMEKYFHSASKSRENTFYFNPIEYIDKWKNGWKFLRYYLEKLSDSMSFNIVRGDDDNEKDHCVRVKLVFFDENKESIKDACKIKNEIDKFIEIIKETNSVPNMFWSAIVDGEFSEILSLICIIDTFVRNVVKHMRGDSENIYFECHKSDNGESGYEFSFRNKTDELVALNGFTRKFLEEQTSSIEDVFNIKFYIDEGYFVARVLINEVKDFGRPNSCNNY